MQYAPQLFPPEYPDQITTRARPYRNKCLTPSTVRTYACQVVENLREWTLEYAKPMISNGLEHLVDAVTPGLAARFATDPNAHDEHIAVLGLASSEAESMLGDAVLAARNSGRTWTQIAEALGIDRATAQARFSANNAEVTKIGTALTASAPEPQLEPGQAVSAPTLGSVRRIQNLKWSKSNELNLLGSYGWRVTNVELNSAWTAMIATAELDNQQWEYEVTGRKKKTPPGIGWTQVDGSSGWTTGVFWARPTGRQVMPGNPEPRNIIG